jgi:ribosome-associated toxin RatA of RatAB toxin-antitoxin module
MTSERVSPSVMRWLPQRNAYAGLAAAALNPIARSHLFMRLTLTLGGPTCNESNESSQVGNALKRSVAVVLLTLVMSAATGADERPANQSTGWALSPSQVERVKSGAVIAEGEVAPDKAAADVRAAIQIGASPEQVFRTLTDCAQALKFVPHLKRCNVIDTASDGSWQDVEQTVDYGWLAPRAEYVFHANYQRYERIDFSHLRGDFHDNRGTWVFHALNGGRTTLVTYQARVVPAFFVPRWLMRSMLKRDLPDLMRGLKSRAEAARPIPAPSGPAGQRSPQSPGG